MEVSYQLDDFSCDVEELLLLRNLKTLGKLWHLASEDSTTETAEWNYNDLAVHLASSAFISNTSIGVKLLTAYNLAQVLRIRQHKHPYNNDQLHNVLFFLINQLERVAHERIDVHKYQEQILDILLMKDVVKLFRGLNKLQQITVHVFSTLIKNAQSNLSVITKERMIKLVGILVEYLSNVPHDIIQMIFYNCQSSNKLSNKMVYDVTVEFIRKYRDTLGPAIGKIMFKDLLGTDQCNHAEENESSAMALKIMKHWMARLWKLHAICNDLTIPILRNLESSLYTMAHKCRCILILFLGKLFAIPANVSLHKVCSSLWKGFLGRFQDKNVEVRLLCLDLVPDLFKIEDLRSGLLSAFRKRKMDRVSRVRKKLASLVSILLKDFDHTCPEVISDLSMILEEIAMDPEVKVRFSSLRHMAELYDFFTRNEKDYLQVLKIVRKYPSCILKHYWVYEKYFNNERLNVIQLINSHILPYSLPPDQRMKRLWKVLATLDIHSCSTLAKIKYQQHIFCKHLLDVINYAKESRAGDYTRKKLAMLNAMAICHQIPLPFKAALQSVINLAWKLSEDDQEAEDVTKILTHKSLEDLDQILESFKADRKYSNEFTWILELSSDWLFDEPSYKIFITYFDDFIRGTGHSLEESFTDEIQFENGFKILEVVSASVLSCCHDCDLICKFISWFRISKDRSVKLHTLKILTMLQAEDKELMTKYPEIMEELILICQDLFYQSDTEMTKWFIRSLMIAEPKREELSHYFLSLVQDLVRNITSPDSLRAYCSIYYLGYVLFYLGTYFKDVLPDILSEQVITNVMNRKESSSSTSSLSFNSLSLEVRIKARYLKLLSQYAFEEGGISYESVLDLLFEVIEKGACSSSSSSISEDENARMRLSAGCSVLRVLRGGRMDMLTCNQFYLLSGLMNDEVPDVRELFFKKLRIALHCDYPKITVPPELLSLVILANFEDSDFEGGEESKIVTTLRYLFSMKLNFIKLHIETEAFSEYGPHVNEVLVYGLLALSQSKILTICNNIDQLHKVKAKLKFFLNFLMTDKDVDSSFYKKQVEMVKAHKLKGENNDSNKKLWTICDIALLQMKKRSIRTSKVTKEPTLPMEFFDPKAIKNSRNYLTKRAIAALFAKGDQSDPKASKKDDEEEITGHESDESEGEMDNLVVMVGEGNITTEDEWNLDDETPFQIDEDIAIDREAPHTHSSNRKRKISEV